MGVTPLVTQLSEFLLGRTVAASGEDQIPIAGVVTISHTADVGIEVRAPSLAELFRRASVGTLWMVFEAIPEDRSQRRALRVTAEDHAGLLRAWLREILYWAEVEELAATELEELRVADGVAEAQVVGGQAPADAVREIKGVTWHGLVVEEREDGWYAHVIFDV